MDAKHKKILQEYHKELLDIDPNENVLDHLFSRDIIHTTDYEEINKNGTKKAKAQALLIRLRSKGPNAFAVLVEALEEEGAAPDVHRKLAACLRAAAAASNVPVPLPDSTRKPTTMYGGDSKADGQAEARWTGVPGASSVAAVDGGDDCGAGGSGRYAVCGGDQYPDDCQVKDPFANKRFISKWHEWIMCLDPVAFRMALIGQSLIKDRMQRMRLEAMNKDPCGHNELALSLISPGELGNFLKFRAAIIKMDFTAVAVQFNEFLPARHHLQAQPTVESRQDAASAQTMLNVQQHVPQHSQSGGIRQCGHGSGDSASSSVAVAAAATGNVAGAATGAVSVSNGRGSGRGGGSAVVGVAGGGCDAIGNQESDDYDGPAVSINPWTTTEFTTGYRSWVLGLPPSILVDKAASQGLFTADELSLLNEIPGKRSHNTKVIELASPKEATGFEKFLKTLEQMGDEYKRKAAEMRVYIPGAQRTQLHPTFRRHVT